jgi:hypothetical protein
MSKTEFDERLEKTWWALRLLFGVVPILAGLDKFFNLLTDWTLYLNPLATKLLPIKPHTFMHLVGIVEMAAGVIVLSRFAKLGAYVVTMAGCDCTELAGHGKVSGRGGSRPRACSGRLHAVAAYRRAAGSFGNTPGSGCAGPSCPSVA